MRHFVFLYLLFSTLTATAQDVTVRDQALPEVKRLMSANMSDLSCEITQSPSDVGQIRSSQILNFVRSFVENSYRAVINQAQGTIVFSNATSSNSVTLNFPSDGRTIESAEFIGRHVLSGATISRVYCE